MANLRVHDLPLTTPVLGTYELEIDDGVVSGRVTAADLKNFVNGDLVVASIVDISASAAEINILEDCTCSTADLNVLSGAGDGDGVVQLSRVVSTINPSGNILLDTSHQNKLLYCTNSSPASFTIQAAASVGFPIGTEIDFWRSNAPITIGSASGVTLLGQSGGRTTSGNTVSLTSSNRNCSIKKVASNTWVCTGDFTVTQYVLDIPELQAAASAYSLRKLRSGYTGQCIRIRRDSDNQQADIPFSNDWIDKVAVASHCGSASGFVVTFYDQSFYGNHATASAHANQFKIWNGNTADWALTIGNRPACVPQTVGTVKYITSTRVVPRSFYNVSLGVISGYKYNASALRAFGFGLDAGGANIWFVAVPAFTNNHEVIRFSPGDTPAVYTSDFVPTLTGSASQALVNIYSGDVGKTICRSNNTDYVSDSFLTTLANSTGEYFVTIGFSGSYDSLEHSFQEGVLWLRPVGIDNCSKYTGNCKSSEWYGSVDYV